LIQRTRAATRAAKLFFEGLSKPDSTIAEATAEAVSINVALQQPTQHLLSHAPTPTHVIVPPSPTHLRGSPHTPIRSRRSGDRSALSRKGSSVNGGRASSANRGESGSDSGDSSSSDESGSSRSISSFSGDDANFNATRNRTATALFNYIARNDRELTINRGDTISNVISSEEAILLGLHVRVPKDWLQGEINGRVGLFPSTYVEVNYSDANYKLCVERDFEPLHADELLLKVGDIITLISTSGDGWYRGRSSKGDVGLFPASHVRLKEHSGAG